MNRPTLCTYYFIVDCSRVARILQKGGGFFGSLIQPKTNLTQIFISLKLDSGGFSVKIRWSPNKKKVFTEIQRFFSAEIRNSRVFFGRMQVIFKKKKVSTEIQRSFPAEIRNSRFFFLAECRWSPAKKSLPRKSKGFSCRNQKFNGFFWPKSGDLQKIGLHRLWVSSWTKKLHYSGPNNGKSFTTSAPKSLWGGCFHFWSKNRSQKH